MARGLPDGLDLHAVAASRRDRDEAVVLLEGERDFAGSWPRIASIGARIVPPGKDPFATIERIVRARRAVVGSPGTGLVALLAYEPTGPDTTLIEVDASFFVPDGGRPYLEAVDAARAAAVREACAHVGPLETPAPIVPAAQVRTSLPRAAYLEGVRRVKAHIRRGDVYQANLTQRFVVSADASPFDLYRRLAAATPAPRSAFVETAGFALVSASPEVFVDAEPGGRVATFPIKGTRPRGENRDDDRRAAAALLASAKDRAELVMIVDLLRNDLGRVCRTGSIEVVELGMLQSFPAVHHLVARVEGDLLPGIGPARLLEAVFPGGSITGAPKLRAMELLRSIEPIPRGAYTGSLFWFGDDGATRSSILIRSIVVRGREASIGAGGGIVADSDPEGEWRESNDKARAPARVLGFEPEEAS